MEKNSHPRIILLLMFLSYLFLMFGNGIVSLTHPDEVFYVQSAKEMLSQHSLMTPYIFDHPQFEKPILTFWFLILSIKWFGLTSFGGRFFPALFGMIGIFATYGLSFLLYKSKRGAFFSAFCLMTSFIYLALSRAVLTDMIFSVWVLLAIACFYWGWDCPKKKFWAILFFFIFCGLAVLTKGILGFVFPFGVAGLFLIYKKEFSYFKNWGAIWGIILFLAIALPWHIAMLQQYGKIFTDEYFKNVHLRRILEAEHSKSDTWYFYLVTIFTGLFPWSFFLPGASFLTYQSIKKNQHKDQLIFLCGWIAVILLIMSFAHSKLASYILPLFPAAAIILGYSFEKVAQEGSYRSWFHWPGYLNASIMLFAVLAIGVVSPRYSQYIADKASVYIAAFFLLVCSFVIFLFNKKGNFVKTISATGLITGCLLIFAFLGYHSAEPWVSCKQICDVFNKENVPSTTLLSSKFYLRAVRFYTDRQTAVININGSGFFSPHPIQFLSKDEEVVSFLGSQPVTYCIVRQADMEDIERISEGKFAVTLLKEIGGKYLLKVDKI